MTKNSYHHGNLKEAIIEEALNLLNSNIKNDFSFRLISRNLGVVSSAPYNHFKDKSDLLKELIELGINKLLKNMEKEKNKSELPSEQLLLIAKSYLNFAIKNKALYNLMFGENNKDLLDLTYKVVLQFEKIISEKFKAGKRVNLTVKGSSITAWSMMHGLAITVNNSNVDFLEEKLNMTLEEILGEMSAIWGKGVSNL